MACMSVSNKIIAVTVKYNSVFVRLSDLKYNLVEAEPTHQRRTWDDVKELSLDVAASAVSPCGKWFAYSINNKLLSVWDIENWQLLASRPIPRGASKICFTPDSKNVIVADKAGEVFSFAVDNLDAKGTSLLGHISILLDMILTPDNFIITCDRDEKIRVSHYPNSYNIQTYCLGHEEFVTSINLFNASAKTIISSSGDGTLKFWNYLTGKLLSTYNCSKDVQPAAEKPIPVTHVQLTQLGPSQIVCVNMHKHNEVLVYHININNFNVNLHQRIPLPKPALSILISDTKDLWTLCGQGVQLYSLDKGRKSFIASSNNFYRSALELVNKRVASFGPSIEGTGEIGVLYKRKFNEMQDYLDKKKARLDGEESDDDSDDGPPQYDNQPVGVTA